MTCPEIEMHLQLWWRYHGRMFANVLTLLVISLNTPYHNPIHEFMLCRWCLQFLSKILLLILTTLTDVTFGFQLLSNNANVNYKQT